MFSTEGWNMRLLNIIAILGLMILCSCDDTQSVADCSSISTPALSIEILDKETGSPISCGTTVMVLDSNFSEDL